MRYALALVALLCALLPSASIAKASQSRVLLDATILVVPGYPVEMCMMVEPGTMAVTSRLVHREGTTTADGRPLEGGFPIDIDVYPYRGRSDMPSIRTTATQAEALAITPILGGLYCLALRNGAYVAPDQNPNFSGQFVALRITVGSA